MPNAHPNNRPAPRPTMQGASHRPVCLAVLAACLLGAGPAAQAGMRNAMSLPGDSSLLFVAIDGGGDFSQATQSLVVDLGVNLSALLPQSGAGVGALWASTATWHFSDDALRINGVTSQAGNSWSAVVGDFLTGASGAVRWGVMAADMVIATTNAGFNTLPGRNLLVTGQPTQVQIDSITTTAGWSSIGSQLNTFIGANNVLGSHRTAENGANLARPLDRQAFLGRTLRDNFDGQLPWRYLLDSQTASPVFLVQAISADPVVQQLGGAGNGVDSLLAPEAAATFSFDAASSSLTLDWGSLPPDPNIRWAQPPGGDWHAAGNWTGSRVPDRDSIVSIGSLGNVTVRLNGTAATVKTLSLGNSATSIPSNITTLALDGATLTAVGDRLSPGAGVTIHATGVIAGPGVIDGTVSNLGRLSVADGTLVVTGPLSNNGRIEVQQGNLKLDIGNGVLFNGLDGVLVLDGGTLAGSLNNTGWLQVVDGSNRIDGTVVSHNAIEFRIGEATDSLARLAVQGELALGGMLVLSSDANFVAQAGQRFDLFDAGRLTGSFSSIHTDGLHLAAGTSLDLSQLHSTGEIAVVATVPEPGTWALLLGGLAGVHLLRRRRRAQPG